MQNSTDDLAIRALVDNFVEGWNQHNGRLLSESFAEDADFMAITGLRASGRDLIARGHDEILSSIYARTTIEADIRSIRYLREDVACVDISMRSTHEVADSKLPRHAEALAVVTRNSGAWKITVFRNMVPFGRPLAGPLDSNI